MDKAVIKDSPCVTVIIPTYNRATLLPEAIRSALAQTLIDIEIVIIDDASTDNTREVVAPFLKDHRVRLFQNTQNKGVAKNRNYGIAIARGVYIAMLDSDDVWLDSNKLASQVLYLEQNADCAVVGTWLIHIDEIGDQLKKIKHAQTDAEIRKSLLYRNHIAQSSVLFRKDFAFDIGGYDETLLTMEDHDLWLRMGVRSKFATIPLYALGYRIHKANITRSQKRRVALDEFSVIWRHRNDYKGLHIGLIKGIARFLKSFIF